MILLIDNYDSFSYNLYQLIGQFEPNIKVIRNDELTIEEIAKLNPKKIVISPGPGKPSKAGIIESVVKEFSATFPILGVCLGHQAICEAFGGTVTYAKKLMHGKQSKVYLNTNSTLFKGLEKATTVARYHSLALDPSTLPQCLDITATTEDNEIMAVQHKNYPVFGVQFHPESILTPKGNLMMRNFINL